MRTIRCGWLILALSLPCWGQSITASYPYIPIVQTQRSRTTTITMDRNVTSGNLLICGWSVESSSGSPTFSDTRSSSWTQLYINTSNSIRVAVYGTILGSSGSEAVTITWTSSAFQGGACAEFPPYWSLTVDASTSTTTTGTPSTFATGNITTAYNNDLLFGYAGGFQSSGSCTVTTSGWQQFALAQGSDSNCTAFSIAGTNGTYGASFINNGNTQVTALIVALKTTPTLAVTSLATAPDGSLTNSYDWCLQAAGGIGAYTWSITSGSLQSGLSLNTSTGCITGTPTAATLNSITFKVTDSATPTPNTATETISLKVGATVNTISEVQFKVGATNKTNLAFTSNVTSGDLVIVSMGFVQSGASGSGGVQYCTDTLNTAFHNVNLTYMLGSGSNQVFPVTQFQAGFAPSTGADTVTCVFSMAGIAEFSGIDYIADDNVLVSSGTATGAGNVTSGSFTPLVPGELFYATGVVYEGAGTMTPQSPLVDLSSDGPQSPAYKLLTTVTTYTATYAKSATTTGFWQILLSGFRPSAGAISPPKAANFVSMF